MTFNLTPRQRKLIKTKKRRAEAFKKLADAKIKENALYARLKAIQIQHKLAIEARVGCEDDLEIFDEHVDRLTKEDPTRKLFVTLSKAKDEAQGKAKVATHTPVAGLKSPPENPYVTPVKGTSVIMLKQTESDAALALTEP